jgi:RNA polymerase sigma-70 factor (ECF subfamily)
MNRIVAQVRRAALLQAGDRPPDAELLELFLSRHDGAAFEAILRRHAPMVLGVCRRVLRHAQDAEDAFQATFLVLARKAASLRSRALLGHWLYGIAFRTALKARAMNLRRRARENRARLRARPETPADGPSEELLARLDAEISRLPQRYRVPVVLCELQGKSRKEVASLLGVPEGTLSSRLAYARKLLARRLGAGASLSGGLLTAVLAGEVPAAVPGALVRATARAGLQVVSGQLLRAGAVSAQVLTLTDGVIKAMFLSKLQGVGVALLALALGVGGLTYRRAEAQPAPAETTAARPAADELEALRLEVAALRKSLEATRQRVKALEQKLERPGRPEKVNDLFDPNVPTGPKRGRPDEPTRPEVPSGAKGLAPENGAKAKGAGLPDLPKRPETAPDGSTNRLDPISAAEKALRRLRERPDDLNAARDLEKALQALRKQERPAASGPKTP